jgi:hypothetical protein
MLNLPWRMGLGQEAELSMPNNQWMNAGKEAKAESGRGVTSQPPRRATSTQHRLGAAQRLRAGAGQQANLSKEPTPSTGQDRHKGWEPGWGNRPTSQSRASGESQSWSPGTEGNIQNWIALPCWGKSWPYRVAAEGQCSYCLVKTRILTTLHELANSHYLPIATNSADRRTKYYTQASHLVRPQQNSCLNTNTRIGRLRNNSRTFTKRLNLLFLLLVFFVVFLFFFPVILTSPVLFSYPYSYPLTFPPFPVLQSIVLPPNYSFCSFSSTLSPSSPPPPTPQPVTTLPLPPTHSPPTD